VLALKLTLVPSFLLLISLAGKYGGPSLAGWLGGLPVVTGPILFFLALEHGDVFASAASTASAAAVFATAVFLIAYAHASQRFHWSIALLAAVFAWWLAAAFLSTLPNTATVSLLVAGAASLAAPRLFPVVQAQAGGPLVTTIELVCRMVAGALFTVAVTAVAGIVGTRWGGLIIVFPVLAVVLAVFSHRSQGAAFVTILLRAMAAGLPSFAAFCLVLSAALPHAGTAASFALAVAVTMAVHALTRRQLIASAARRSS
jgi:hypothetical protein